MKARRALCLLLVLLAASTAVGWVLASTYWLDMPVVNLRLDSEDGLLVLISFVGDAANMKWPFEGNLKTRIKSALAESLPIALRQIALQSGGMPCAIGLETQMPGLCISWKDDECMFEYADGATYVCPDGATYVCPDGVTHVCEGILPGGVKPGEDGWLRIVGIHCAVSFANEAIASAVLSVCLDRDSSQAPDDPAWVIDTEYFWSEGRVVYPVSDGSKVLGLTIQLEPLDGAGEGTRALTVPDCLLGLADCIEGHLIALGETELDAALKDASLDTEKELHDIAMLVRRKCKIDGRIIDNCWIEHSTYTNGHTVSPEPQLIPPPSSSITYGMFGI